MQSLIFPVVLDIAENNHSQTLIQSELDVDEAPKETARLFINRGIYIMVQCRRM